MADLSVLSGEVNRLTQIYSEVPITDTLGARPTQPPSAPRAAGR
jgi:hypothetical protein